MEHTEDILDEELPTPYLWFRLQVWDIHEASETGLEHILEPLLCKFFEVFILIAIASPFFEVPVKGHLVKFVERPHHQVQRVPT